MPNANIGDAAAAVRPVTPRGGAGLFDVDPDQDEVSQDHGVAVIGDADAFPEEAEV